MALHVKIPPGTVFSFLTVLRQAHGAKYICSCACGNTVEVAAKFLRNGNNKNGKQLRLGLFDTEEDAAMAYDAAAIEHRGEFARANIHEQGTLNDLPG